MRAGFFPATIWQKMQSGCDVGSGIAAAPN